MGVIYYKLDAACKTKGDTLRADFASKVQKFRVNNKSFSTTLKNYLNKPQLRESNVIQRN